MKTKKTWLTLFFAIIISLPVNSFSQTKNLKIGEPAPTFVLKSLNGNYVYLRDFCGKLRPPIKLKKQHVVIISFFATWCKPCMKETQELKKIAEQFKDKDLKLFLINLKEEKSLVKKFSLNKDLPGMILLDRYGVVAKKYGVSSLPRLFLIDRKGKLAWMTKGYKKNLSQILIKKISNLLYQ